MKQRLLLLALILIIAGPARALRHSLYERSYSRYPRGIHLNDIYHRPVAPLAVSGTEGVSGAFAGRVNGKVLVAGGCNFPNTPLVEGGQKVFYRDVFLLDGGKWQPVGNLMQPVAYGASVTTPQGLVCLGGTPDGLHSQREGYLLSLAEDNFLRITPTVPLPIGLHDFTASYGDGYIYLAAGLHDTVPSHKAYRLAWPNGTRWEELPDVPGLSRIQPSSAVQNSGRGNCFYLFGGYDPDSCLVLGEGLRYDPASRKWSGTELCLYSSVGTQAMPAGAHHILIFGGVDASIFRCALHARRLPPTLPPDADYSTWLAYDLYDSYRGREYLSHAPDWYEFNQCIMVYHTITDRWFSLFPSPLMARAGASLVPLESDFGRVTALLIDGELKPGVRSADVTQVEVTYTPHFGTLNWVVLICYLLFMLYIGFYFSYDGSLSTDAFFKGSGTIPWWAASISIFATMLSAITYMSIPAKSYATDWTYYPMQVCILIVAFPVVRYFLPFFRGLNLTTAYEYLQLRFNKAVRVMASLLFMTFMLARTALVLYLPSLAMTAVTGINIYLCIGLMAVITIIYCTMGGLKAVVWGDVFQGFVLLLGAVMAVTLLVVSTGTQGYADFMDLATSFDKFRLFLYDSAHPFDYVNATWWVVILGGLANNLISYTSDQTVIQRYLTTPDLKSAGRSVITNGLISVVVSILFFTIGTGLYTFYRTHPNQLDITMARGDAIFPFYIMSQMPEGFAGLLIAAIFAATMSTISSNINSISTAFTVDIWALSGRRQATVRTARVAGIVAGLGGMLIAFLMASTNIHSLLDYFNTILGLLSGALAGLFIIGIFLPRVGSGAAIVGFVSGTACVVYMNFCTRANFLLFGFISLSVCVVVSLIASLFLPQAKEQSGLTWKSLQQQRRQAKTAPDEPQTKKTKPKSKSK